MKLANEIQRKLINWCVKSSYDIVIPNFFVNTYEMDVFKLTANGYIFEYEIKISKQDFLRDFKKGKHETIHHQCNRFFFVVPEGLIESKEIPNKYGVVFYNKERRKLWVARTAKLLNKTPMASHAMYKDIAIKLANRERNLRNKLLELTFKIQDLEKIS